MLVQRTVRIEGDKENAADTSGEALHVPIESLRTRHAYVLLGDPGMGKSSAFEVEAAAVETKPIRAHDFIALLKRAEDWADKPIFIDGLDETRAGSKGGRTSLDAIRSKLDGLGRPSFRLSCRAADWLGESDKTAMQRLMPDGEKLEVAHLDQLTYPDVEKILSENFNIENPREFSEKAERNRIGELLVNPLTLRLLAEAVGNGSQWPASRRETYELACEKLAAETNIEHRAAQRANPTSRENLLAAAGYLCAINLISDVQRFSPLTGDDSSTLGLDAIKNPDDLPLSMALRTRLFHSLGDDEFAPVHRSIAEFLAARFVGKRVASSLPTGRIRALISGADGVVVTELRAFAAWLGVFSAEFRPRQIDFDPLGILIFGDARNFHAQDKRLILDSIKRLGDSVGKVDWSDWHAQTSEVLGTPDMAGEFERILRTAPTTDGDQLVADCVVEAIHLSKTLPDIGPVLLSVARDSRWWGGIRKIALRTVLASELVEKEAIRKFLADVHSGAIQDDDDELLGVLLENLYPTMISPECVFNYFRARKKSNFLGNYSRFWRQVLFENTASESLSRLLDAVRSLTPLQWNEETRELWEPMNELVAHGIELLGTEVSDEALYEWLGICLDERDHSHVNTDTKKRVHKWFQERPERYKGVLQVALDRTPDTEHLRWSIHAHLLGAPVPVDIGAWWLRQADQATTEERAKIYFHNAFFIDDAGAILGGLTLEELEEWVRHRPKFSTELDNRLTSRLLDNEWRTEDSKRKREYASRKQVRVAQFRSVLGELLTNKAHPQTLYWLALAYLKHLADAHGDTPEARLADFLDDDQELVSAALAALRDSVTRTDLPSPKDILDSDRKGKIFHLTPPLLVGMELIWKSDPVRVAKLDDALLLKALVSYYVFHTNEDAGWFEFVLIQRPDLVVEAHTMYLLARLKGKKEFVQGAYQLAHDAKFATVAAQIASVVLRAFPHRALKSQLSVLEHLLKAALQYMEKSAFSSLLRDRLNLKSLDVAQRIYWLAAGTLYEAGKYLEPLVKYVAMNEIRVGHLGAFLYREHGEAGVANALSIRAMGQFVELIGPSCRPDRYADGIVTADMNRADLVRSWINTLAVSHEAGANTELQRLLALPALCQWADALGHAQAQQKIVLRDFGFIHPNHAQVTDTLYQGPPANAADIAAIVNEVLASLGKEIGTSDNNLYRQFWNVDEHGRITNPRPEEACRDALAELLRPRLRKYQIECLAETRHVGEKRSDIWCMFKQWGVPVEVKRDRHPKIWSAAEQQLIRKYTIDPRAQGFGVYVVLWFGGGSKMPAPETGRKPTTAQQLLQRLSEQVPEQYRKLIEVHVIDAHPSFDGS